MYMNVSSGGEPAKRKENRKNENREQKNQKKRR